MTLVNQRRWDWLGAACGLAIFIVGLMFTSRTILARFKYALAMVIDQLLERDVAECDASSRFEHP